MSSPPLKILVAESDPIVLALLSHILHRQGYTVDVADSADNAAKHLSRNDYRAIVIDSKLATCLDAFPDHMTRVILLSPQRDSDLPVHAVVQKPVEFGLLVDTVAACVK